MTRQMARGRFHSLRACSTIDRAVIRFDQSEAVIVRMPTPPYADVLSRLVGTYETPLGRKIGVKLSRAGDISLFHPGEPADVLKPFKGLQFRSSDFPDITFEFVLEEEGRARALRHWNAHVELEWPRIDDSIPADALEDEGLLKS